MFQCLSLHGLSVTVHGSARAIMGSNVSRTLPAKPALRERFFDVEATSGITLLAAAVVALLWTNSGWAGSYHALWELPLNLGASRFAGPESLRFWVNDGLMAIFFLLVGLEIRRELHEGGALADTKLVALPLAAASGGVLAPALIYTLLNKHTDLLQGWAVPTATDIAFAIGVLALLGRRVPPALRVLLLAIAIIDDIVAILVIALFYSNGIHPAGLWLAGLGILSLAVLNATGVRSMVFYVVVGVAIWTGLMRAGVHPALSGVIVGLLTPQVWVRRAEHALHPWVAFGIMPLFALANAGVSLEGIAFDPHTTGPLAMGIIVGLVAGKPVGIVLSTALCLRLRWCALPWGVGVKQIVVVGCLAGIGFTMSIFISQLAFANPTLLATAKLAVLIASSTAALVGLLAGWWLLKPPAVAGQS
jgi:Na+:H+ antiporter, NhaA family